MSSLPLELNQVKPFGNPISFLTDKDVSAAATNLISANSKLPPVVCHGRVQNPEAYVPKAWWKSVFGDNLYLQTDGDVVEDPAITLEEIRLLESYDVIRSIFQSKPAPFSASSSPLLFFPDRARILDLCCGQGRHLLQLAQLYPYLELHGHDQSQYLIELAQSRAAAANVHKQVRFTIGDCCSVPHPDNSFDLVIVMGNSFGYFATDRANKGLLEEICRVLKPGGYAVLDIPDGGYLRENFSARGWEWISDTMIACRERELSKDKKRLISREVIISTTQGVIRDQFYAECLYSLEELKQLINEAGLVPLSQGSRESQEGQAVATNDTNLNLTGKDMSKRGEDLGMMEQRHLVLVMKPLAP
ncbi:hypothetical protein BX616_004520 [Lobosporangium transversale]|uniref:S-adenosyl-L-methionine-dependent methyltransferase n=1 Tax=Lobosporangium transversale TaxID=64571 RepID=A0A1Y2GI60_9FUNG|nr:S-adenosyl-L-methionine-dependent methyltransferase [Lobosporangium transversale]KAF9916138.1 hypothetical protein BX616_004520 [Lobosporangium transversale]ORZ11396.1 S-adenosyl-L-methionine-dependent methyltransferase [Lobosporangium transversale]|eukprot:XP_021879711.1 S-adenosyl-L-methionine-dependent methyltransferase [Lobosporangium transversale]